VDTFFSISYRDPLVGIISLSSIIFIVWIINSLLSRYKKLQKSKQLEKFVENFTKTSTDEVEFEKLVTEFPSSAKMLSIVGKGYYLSGEYEKAARFFALILKYTLKTDKQTNAKIMLHLAKSFIKLGFLGRAKTTLIEILRLQPKNEDALKELIGLYIRVNDYEDTLGALQALEELDEKYTKYNLFFAGVKAIKIGLKIDTQIENEPYFIREKAKLLIANNNQKALFELSIQNQNARYLLDILWRSYPNDDELEIIKKSSLLMELFAAKNMIKADSFKLFELEMMSYIYDKNIADILFGYRCTHCGKEELDFFAICKKCLSLSTCEITLGLTRKSTDEFNMDSFS